MSPREPPRRADASSLPHVRELAAGLGFGSGLVAATVLAARPLLFGFADPSIANSLVTSIVLLLIGTVFVKSVLDGSLALPPPEVATPLGFLLFLGLVLTVFSAHVWPAELVLTSWITTALVFFSVYALAAGNAPGSEAARRTVTAAVLATAAVVALYGIWQRRFGLDLMREEIMGTVAGKALLTVPGAPHRVASNEVSATFVTSNAFAGYLVLLLPPAIGIALAARAAHRMLAGIAAWGLVTLLGIALYLTGSTGGVVAGVAGVAAFASLLWGGPLLRIVRARLPKSRRARRAVLASAAAVGLAGAVIAAVCLLRHKSMMVRLDYWRAAGRMIAHHPTGVGLGNFSDFYTHYKTPSGWETREAHNVYLGLAAEAGVAALIALVFLVRGFFRSALKAPPPGAEEPGRAGPEDLVRPRILGLAGGVSGVLIAYLIAYMTGSLPTDTVARLFDGTADGAEVVTALMFLAFVPLWAWLFWTFHRIDIASPAVRAGLLAGIAGLLVHGLADFDFKIKATMLTAAALGACAVSRGRSTDVEVRGGRSFVLSFMVVGALALVFWRGTLRTSRLSLYAAVAKGEEDAASELDLLRRRSRLLADSPRPGRGGIRRVLAKAHELGFDAAAADLGRALASGDSRRLSDELRRLAGEAGMEQEKSLRRSWEFRSAYVEAEPGDERQVYRLGVLGDRLKPVARDVEVDAVVENAFRRFTERSPESFAGWMLLGNLLTRHGHMTEAAANYEEAAARYPLRPELWTLLGDARTSFDPEGATSAYARALEVNRVVEDYGTTLFAKLWESAPRRPRSGRLVAELGYVEEKTGPTPGAAWRLGLAYVSAGGYEEAAAEFEKALKLKPDEVQLAVFRWLALEMKASQLRAVADGEGDSELHGPAEEAERAARAARQEADELQKSVPAPYRLPAATLRIIRMNLHRLRKVAGGRRTAGH